MESRLYRCSRYRKSVKSTNDFTRHTNACKILITLLNCQPSTPALILKYNTINHPDLLSDNFIENINLRASNNNE